VHWKYRRWSTSGHFAAPVSRITWYAYHAHHVTSMQVISTLPQGGDNCFRNPCYLRHTTTLLIENSFAILCYPALSPSLAYRFQHVRLVRTRVIRIRIPCNARPRGNIVVTASGIQRLATKTDAVIYHGSSGNFCGGVELWHWDEGSRPAHTVYIRADVLSSLIRAL